MKTITAVKWYYSKEAKRGRVGHLAGHPRLGASFSKCGKTLGREAPRGGFQPCSNCGIEQTKEQDREKKTAAMEAAAPRGEMPKTPELDRMAVIKDKSQMIGEFLEWLNGTKGWTLAKAHVHGPKCEGWDEGRGRFNPRGMESYCQLGPDGRLWMEPYTTENLLAEFFEIDLNKVEQERRSILDAIRSKT